MCRRKNRGTEEKTTSRNDDPHGAKVRCEMLIGNGGTKGGRKGKGGLSARGHQKLCSFPTTR